MFGRLRFNVLQQLFGVEARFSVSEGRSDEMIGQYKTNMPTFVCMLLYTLLYSIAPFSSAQCASQPATTISGA